jgi:hypothetical protein
MYCVPAIVQHRIYQQMLQLETTQVQQPGSIPAAEVAAAYASINAQLNSLVAQGDDIEDTATRSALLYMDALFNSSSEGPSADSTTTSSSSSDASLSSQQQQQQQQQQQRSVQPQGDVQQQGGQPDAGNQQGAAAELSSSSSSSARGGVSLQKLQRLGKFLAAAACLEPYQTLLSVLSDKRPHLASEELLFVSALQTVHYIALHCSSCSLPACHSHVG